MKKLLNQIVNEPKLVADYLQGTIRLFLYNHIPFLIRPHIKEQFEIRKIQAKDCLLNTTCLSCGCKTPDVFFCNRACSLSKYDEYTRIVLKGKNRICYPKMLNKKQFKQYKEKHGIK